MKAVAYRLSRLLRTEWRTVAILSLVVGLVSGSVLTFAVGADRTSSAPDRYTVATGGGYDAEVQQESGPPRTAEVAALPGVSSVEAVTFLFGGLSKAGEESPAENAIVFAGSARAFGNRLSAGREPDPASSTEFVASRNFVDELNVELGDRFDLYVLTQAQADAAGFDAFADGLGRPRLQGTLVGIVQGPSELEDPTPLAVFPPALLDDADVGVSATIMSVRLRPETDLAALRTQLDTVPGGEALSADRSELISADVRTAVQGAGRALWLIVLVGAIAAVVALGQLLVRHIRLSSEDTSRLRAVGFTRRQVWAESEVRALLPIVVGTLLGGLLATVLSPLFPRGFVRKIEPHPGIWVDAAVLVGCGGLLIGGLVLWTLAALVVARPARGERPAASVEWVAVRCPTAPLSTGIRFAFTHGGRDWGSVRASITGLVAATALVVGAIVFGSSLARLLGDSTRFGLNFDAVTGTGGDRVPDELLATLESDPDVASVTLYGMGQARVGAVTLGLAGFRPVKGGGRPVILEGRPPSADDEVALGRLVARKLSAGVGDELLLEGEGSAERFRVTGIAVVPNVEGLGGVGEDSVVTLAGLTRIDPAAQPATAAFSLRPGAPAGTLRRLGFGQNSLPAVISNLGRIRGVPSLFSVLLGALALLTLAHVLLTSLRNRRRDMAVLRAVGADRRWITRAVHWQATTVVAVPLVLGIPLGLIAGRLVFRVFAENVGTVPDASVPYLLLTGVIVASLALANAVAALPARRARRLAPAPLLSTE